MRSYDNERLIITYYQIILHVTMFHGFHIELGEFGHKCHISREALLGKSLRIEKDGELKPGTES